MATSVMATSDTRDFAIGVGAMVGDRYRLERPVGNWGMASVSVAWDQVLDQRVAIRVLRKSLAREASAQESFAQVARSAAAIDSDHILRLLDIGTCAEGTPYVVSEYPEGPSLAQLHRALGPLTEREVAAIGLQLCSALQAAHAAQVGS